MIARALLYGAVSHLYWRTAATREKVSGELII